MARDGDADGEVLRRRLDREDVDVRSRMQSQSGQHVGRRNVEQAETAIAVGIEAPREFDRGQSALELVGHVGWGLELQHVELGDVRVGAKRVRERVDVARWTAAMSLAMKSSRVVNSNRLAGMLPSSKCCFATVATTTVHTAMPSPSEMAASAAPERARYRSRSRSARRTGSGVTSAAAHRTDGEGTQHEHADHHRARAGQQEPAVGAAVRRVSTPAAIAALPAASSTTASNERWTAAG